MAAAMTAFVVALCGGTAEAGPLCSGLGPLPLADFDSCVANGNDHLPSVQLVLNAVLEPNVGLNGALSFSPEPESAGGEFNGDNAAAGFNITPNTVGNTNSFEFISLPTGTFAAAAAVPEPSALILQGRGRCGARGARAV
jgi:hypothetical protein